MPDFRNPFKKKHQTLEDPEVQQRRREAQIKAHQNRKDVERVTPASRPAPQAGGQTNNFSPPSMQPTHSVQMPDHRDFRAGQGPVPPPKEPLAASGQYRDGAPPAYTVHSSDISSDHIDQTGETVTSRSNTAPASGSVPSDGVDNHNQVMSRRHPLRAQPLPAAELDGSAIGSPHKYSTAITHHLTTRTSDIRVTLRKQNNPDASPPLSNSNISMYGSEITGPYESSLQSIPPSRDAAHQPSYLHSDSGEPSEVEAASSEVHHRQPAPQNAEQNNLPVALEDETTARDRSATQQSRLRGNSNAIVPDKSYETHDESSAEHSSHVAEQQTLYNQSPSNSTIKEQRESNLTSTEEILKLQEQHEAEMSGLRKSMQIASEEARAEREAREAAHSRALQSIEVESVGLRKQLKVQAGDLDRCRLELSETSKELETTRQTVRSAKNDVNLAREAQKLSLQEIKSLKGQLHGVYSEVDQLKQSHARELASTRQRHADDQGELYKDIDTLNRKLKAKEAEAREHHNAMISSQRQEIDRLNSKKQQELWNLDQKHKTELGILQQKLTTVNNKHSQDINRLVEAKQREAQQVTQKHKNELDTLLQQLKTSEEDYTREMNQTNQAWEAEISKLKKTHKTENNTIQQELQSVTREAKQSQQRLISKHTQDMDKLTAESETRLAEQTKAHEDELSEMAIHYQKCTQQMRADVERLNAALLTRDDDLYRGELFTASGLPAKPDDKIAAQFSAIEQMVDGIGRLQWKQEPLVWTNEKLEKIRGQHVDRVLKKAIVQDLIWSLLHYYIFSSPFRVFQAEGKKLEMQWSQECGGQNQGSTTSNNNTNNSSNNGVYKWPAPGAKAERWRYMTIKECRDALRPPVPSDHDPRSRLRQGFTTSMNEFMSAATTALDDIIDLSAADVDTLLARLSKKAATVWLEFAAYRCRIVIGLKGPANPSAEAKVAMAMATSTSTAQTGALELTVVPTVGRYGNVMGTDLDNYKIIDRCVGDSIVVRR